jgi:hypothetical protein
MIAGSDKFYNKLIDSTEKWKDSQIDIQNQQTNFAIQQIEQQKEQTQKDYEKEQAGAYVDWRKQSNQYGTEAEKMASAGLANTGYSESSQVSMYNTYQNRAAVARESFMRAWEAFGARITEARNQNNAALAAIATQVFEKQAELTLQAYQYKNSLLSELFDREMQVKQFYENKWQNVLSQMNTENAMAEEVRQFNENQKFQTEQAALNRTFEEQQAELDRDFEAAQAELNRQFELDLVKAKTEAEKAILVEQYNQEMAKLKKQHEYNMAQLDKQLANEKSLLAYKNSLKTTYSTGPSTTKKSSSNTVKSAYFSPGASAKVKASSNIGFTGSTHKEALAYAKKMKLKGFQAMDETEWSRYRNHYLNTGDGAKEVVGFSSYKAYIQNYMKYLIQNSN